MSNARPKTYPKFSWDTVPVFAHLGKPAGDFNDTEQKFLAEHFPLIAIEKTQSMKVQGSKAESAIIRVAQGIKSFNPQTKILYYQNSYIDYPMYGASSVFQANPDWALKDKNGNPVTATNRKLPTYDISNPAMRQWWVERAKTAAKHPAIDGLFVDAVSTIIDDSKSKRQNLEEGKYDAMNDAVKSLFLETRKAIGKDKLIIYNGMFAHQELAGDGASRFIDFADGIMVEHFAALSGRENDGKGKIIPERLASEIELIPKLAAKGKLVFVKGFPCKMTWFPDDEFNDFSQEDRLNYAKEKIIFPLAAFLIAAEENCYFGYSWGYHDTHGWFQWYPEFDKPLGQPMASAIKNGWVYTREFEHAYVWLDVENEKAGIDWH